ncbi:DNA mismatch repair protein MutS [Haliangium sp.]|uniref:DNA mismatch repair protein MutS n=1 Tax=Haliangium sp. TaxID=2663208 RepID=UPI003D110E55
MASASSKSPRETPLMRQYLGIKAQHPDAILFFRLGDFYEMFYEDAELVSKALDLTLTSRHKNTEEPVPMAGVPHHSARGYIARLTEQGYKVAVCEQVEDPKLVKGIVKREVAQIITPGVVLDDEVLDPKAARYLAAVAYEGSGLGLAYLDVSTGEFRATELPSGEALAGELARVRPAEILAGADALGDDGVMAPVCRLYRDGVYTSIKPHTWKQAETLLTSMLAGDSRALGLVDAPLAARAAADVVSYARATQPNGVLPVSRLQLYAPGQAMVLDEVAIANLELTETLIGAKRAGSLLSVIDATSTAPGGRLLRRWLLYPLTEVAPIRRRQDAVGYLVERASLRSSVRHALDGVHDLERLSARVLLGVATPRDLGRLRDSLALLPELARLLSGQAEGEPASDLVEVPELLGFDGQVLEILSVLQAVLARALVDEPGPLAREGGFVRDGYCADVDESRRLATGGKDAILEIEQRERERTGISSLKVKYNRVFGYYIAVTKPNLDKVPADYVRRQTTANGERFITPELSELEAKVLGAEVRVLEREQEILGELCDEVTQRAACLREVAQRIATVDSLAGLAEVAHVNGYVCPTVDEGEVIDIVEGRHPVVERVVPPGSYVPNDCRLDSAGAQFLLVTGPNMAGKSTYMRQVAHIVLLAQMGSFVPARRATIGAVDRIFTRVGAADDLARGESTFMVEMRETAAIVREATRRSLVVLDEVGRGTSTFDGLSIAWAVSEYLHDAIGCRTLFATHYHELTALADSRPKVRNVSVAVREHEGEIVFLRQVVEGGASKSYGIDVARLAGLPRSVIARARQILGQLEDGTSWHKTAQLSLFGIAQAAPPEVVEDTAGPVMERLRGLDPHRTTPIEALQILVELCEQARG